MLNRPEWIWCLAMWRRSWSRMTKRCTTLPSAKLVVEGICLHLLALTEGFNQILFKALLSVYVFFSCQRSNVWPASPGALNDHLRGPDAHPAAQACLEQAGPQLPSHCCHGRLRGHHPRCQSTLHSGGKVWILLCRRWRSVCLPLYKLNSKAY